MDRITLYSYHFYCIIVQYCTYMKLLMSQPDHKKLSFLFAETYFDFLASGCEGISVSFTVIRDKLVFTAGGIMNVFCNIVEKCFGARALYTSRDDMNCILFIIATFTLITDHFREVVDTLLHIACTYCFIVYG